MVAPFHRAEERSSARKWDFIATEIKPARSPPCPRARLAWNEVKNYNISMCPRTALLLLIFTTLLAGCAGSLPAPPPAARSYPDRGAQSDRLNVGMTEAEVVAILGEPAHKTLSTCGRTFRDPWSCRKWNYNGGGAGNNLEVRFRNMSDKDWTVNSWRTY